MQEPASLKWCWLPSSQVIEIGHEKSPDNGYASGVWRSLVARFVRDEEVVGSNPATPTGLWAAALRGRPDLAL